MMELRIEIMTGCNGPIPKAFLDTDSNKINYNYSYVKRLIDQSVHGKVFIPARDMARITSSNSRHGGIKIQALKAPQAVVLAAADVDVDFIDKDFDVVPL